MAGWPEPPTCPTCGKAAFLIWAVKDKAWVSMCCGAEVKAGRPQSF